MTPAEKLERSRLAIVEYLERGQSKRQPRFGSQAGADDLGDDTPEGKSRGFFSRPGWVGGVSSAARAWWRHHPAQLAVEMASPALASVLRKHPFPILALSVGVGALVVVTRPWRLISVTTLVVALVKSSQLSGVVMSALSDAQGWHEQQRGREPQL